MAKKSWMNVVIKAALITGGVAVYVFVETGTRDQLSRMENKIDLVETKLTARIDRVETKLTARIDRVETKLMAQIDRVDTRIDRVDSRLDRVETRLDRVETKIDEISGYLRYKFGGTEDESAPSGMKE